MLRAAKVVAMKQRIEDVRQRLAQEEARVAELSRDGQVTDDTRRLLNEIKETLRLMEAHRAAFVRTHRAGAGGA
jgi:hypothetical protein